MPGSRMVLQFHAIPISGRARRGCRAARMDRWIAGAARALSACHCHRRRLRRPCARAARRRLWTHGERARCCRHRRRRRRRRCCCCCCCCCSCCCGPAASRGFDAGRTARSSAALGEAARKRGSEAARQRGSEAATRRGGEAASLSLPHRAAAGTPADPALHAATSPVKLTLAPPADCISDRPRLAMLLPILILGHAVQR